MKKFRILSTIVLSAFVLSATACTVEPNPPVTDREHTLSFLTTEGEMIVNAEGERVQLRGINAGGLGVIEGWMTGFATERGAPNDGTPGGTVQVRDHYTVSKVWLERFGYDDTLALWENYQSAWWTEADFQNCAEMGINVIRLPFTYMDIDFDAVVSYENAGDFDFTFLDNFVDMAEEYGIYTILDLHGAYGSQNGQDHSGQAFDSATQVTFYDNEELLSLTTDLWRAVAEHFKDNPAVAGYDLLNEPVEKGDGETGKRHWNALDRFYDAIRETGDEHIVIFESCWGANGLPMPETYGWKNCMYSFHHYTGDKDENKNLRPLEWLVSNMQSRVNEIDNQNFGVPIYMGEFTCYENEGFWNFTLALFNKHGWHWTSWTYKIWGTSGWGVYNIITYGETKINAHYDDYDSIRKSFRTVRTDTNTVKYAFPSGATLFSIIKAACGGSER